MSENDNSTASYWVKRTEQKQRVMRAEAKDRVVTRDHHKRLNITEHTSIITTTVMTF